MAAVTIIAAVTARTAGATVAAIAVIPTERRRVRTWNKTKTNSNTNIIFAATKMIAVATAELVAPPIRIT